MNIQKHIKIYGKVQGVGYRNWLQSFAIEYGVFGWVKNNVNGEVEAVLIGQEEVVSSLIEQCYMGPPNSNVEKILIEDSDDIYDLRSFEIVTDN
ncbi:MAG: acylphosphatase [Gammaproteobacteria bacterium]